MTVPLIMYTASFVRLLYIDNRIKVICFAKNFRRDSAVLAAYRAAVGDIVVTLDDDGQCPVENTWQLIDALNDDVDIVFAKYPKKAESLFKRFGSKVYYTISKILVDTPKNVVFENFSVAKSFDINELIHYKNPYPDLTPLLLQVTHKIANVQMGLRPDRIGGVSPH